jgi:hypothetical protein
VHGYYTAQLAHPVMCGVGWLAGLALPRRPPQEDAAAP